MKATFLTPILFLLLQEIGHAEDLHVNLMGVTKAAGHYTIEEKMGIIEFLYDTAALKNATCTKHVVMIPENEGKRKARKVNVYKIVTERLNDPTIDEDVLIAIPQHILPCTSEYELKVLLKEVPIYLKERKIEPGVGIGSSRPAHSEN